MTTKILYSGVKSIIYLNVCRQFCTKLKITEQTVNVNGININYVQSSVSSSAESSSKSVLLMPGALGSAWSDFKPQIDLLPSLLPNYTVIAWDPPGYGKSIPPRRTFPLDFYQKDAEYAKKFMEKLGRQNFSILGWSDGGITGLILAGRYPSYVDKLVIWGAGAYINKDEVKALENIRDVKKWSPKMREPMEKIYGVEEFAILWSEWVDGALNIHKKKNGDLCKEEVEKVSASTFILHGKKDPMIAAEHIPYLRERIKGVKYYEFPDGKHNIHLRYADEFNKLVAEFLMK